MEVLIPGPPRAVTLDPPLAACRGGAGRALLRSAGLLESGMMNASADGMR